MKSVEFWRSGRGKAQCPPNPEFPEGVDINLLTGEGEKHCPVQLPYPAPECGAWIVRCSDCGMNAIITAAGRPDDPRSVNLPCRFDRRLS